mmetsp:Transcript_41902/g.94664  ORF Transcript_41902/g.94664 Transcript_41902/m.94664 type:complete len:1160 (+) Transcript_41902:159-3638(+)
MQPSPTIQIPGSRQRSEAGPDFMHRAQSLQEPRTLWGYEQHFRREVSNFDGFLEQRQPGGAWVQRYCVLSGGEFKIYDPPTDPEDLDGDGLELVQSVALELASAVRTVRHDAASAQVSAQARRSSYGGGGGAAASESGAGGGGGGGPRLQVQSPFSNQKLPGAAATTVLVETLPLLPKHREEDSDSGGGGGSGSLSISDGSGGGGGAEGGGRGVEVAVERVRLEGCSLEWDDGSLLLEDVTMSVNDRQLVVCVGSTGAGKSGLLASLIGELVPTKGKLSTCGSIAYVAQTAWIQNASLRDNVLFGLPLDSGRYQEVLGACALEADLAMLADGDATEIGEKGINLSGGQKQRVAIARAVYSDADVYLLDDCLSAVDSQVAHHIFARCIKNPRLLGSKAVLLVTHNLALLPHADQVLLLADKKVKYLGPYAGFLSLEGDSGLSAAARAQEASASLHRSGSKQALEAALADSAAGRPPLKPVASNSALARFAAPAEAAAEAAAAEGAAEDGAEAAAAKGTAAAAATKAGAKASSSGSEGFGKRTGEGGKLIEKEAMARGSVSMQVYKTYIQACGSYTAVLGVLGGLMAYNIVNAASSWWISYWSDHPKESSGDESSSGGVLGPLTQGQGLAGYACFSLAAVFLSFVSVWCATSAGQRACRLYHARMVEGVLRAPMSFFDITPLGRIVNRFSKDVYTLDEQLPWTLYSWLSTALACAVALATVAFVVPWFLAACVPMGYVYYQIMNLYIPTSRELQRLESVTRSPVFSHFGETLEGVSTIRAFRAEPTFVTDSFDKLERNLRSYYANVSSNRWLALRLEAIGTGFVTLAALLAVLGAGSISGGLGGLALTYALNITQSLNWYVRMSSDRESQVVAAERLDEYAHQLSQEAPAIVQDSRPPPDWPSQGEVVFERAAMRYRPGLPLVLKGDSGRGLDCVIQARQKVGVVGRTGSGKSSLLLLLLRLVEPEEGARILVDGVDVLKMGLQDLRSRISIIPQDPVLFTGTVRFNVDPFGAHSDAAVWSALDRAHLGAHIRSLQHELDTEVDEGGRNLSLGERQLLCLARALLRKSRILLLDEATSAVDQHTDSLVQATIRREFAACTVLTIAHRLDTVADCDRVLVLGEGRILEDDHPKNLLDPSQYPEGVFRAMWDAHHQEGDMNDV